MKRILLPFIIILLMSGNTAWAGGLFPGTSGVSDAKDVKFDNTEASLTGDPDDVQTAIEAVKTEIGNIEAGGLADIDDLPGDTVDDNKIDSSLINNATSTGLGVASFPNTTFTVSKAGAVSIKANVFQPHSATLADFSEGSPTGTYDLSSATITFGLEASDIPDISGTYATAGHNHTGTYEPADATIMKTGSYANLTAINAVSPSSGYLRYNGSAFVYDSDTQTLTNKTLGDGTTPVRIVYDPTPATDATVSGDLISVVTTAGLNAVAGDLVYVANTGGTDGPIVALADADSSSTVGAVFLITESISAGNAGKALVSGVMRLDSWNWSGANRGLFISAAAGDMTETAPSTTGQHVQKIGYSLTPDIILFRPSVDFAEVQ